MSNPPKESISIRYLSGPDIAELALDDQEYDVLSLKKPDVTWRVSPLSVSWMKMTDRPLLSWSIEYAIQRESPDQLIAG